MAGHNINTSNPAAAARLNISLNGTTTTAQRYARVTQELATQQRKESLEAQAQIRDLELTQKLAREAQLAEHTNAQVEAEMASPISPLHLP